MVELEKWEADSISLNINFSDPLLISQQLTKDKLYFKFKDQTMFVAADSGNSLSKEYAMLTTIIPQ